MLKYVFVLKHLVITTTVCSAWTEWTFLNTLVMRYWLSTYWLGFLHFVVCYDMEMDEAHNSVKEN